MSRRALPLHGGVATASGVDHWWMRDGACTSRTELPWVSDADQVHAEARRRMEDVCISCPVLARCENYVHGAAVTAGFWAGRSRSRGDGPMPAADFRQLELIISGPTDEQVSR